MTSSIKASGSINANGFNHQNSFHYEPPISKLVDLVNSNFEMSPNDRDYRLNHEQLIKVCKILLHKLNTTNVKGSMDRDAMFDRIDEKVKQGEMNNRSQLEEVS